jgi:hypothetical protein
VTYLLAFVLVLVVSALFLEALMVSDRELSTPPRRRKLRADRPKR